MFKRPLNPEIEAMVKSTIIRARVTLVEYLLIDGAILSTQPATWSDGRDQIHEQIEAMQAPEAEEDKIGIDSINGAIWAAAQIVCRGGHLEA